MRVLILGAGGWIGKRVASRLLKAGHEVLAFRRSTTDDIAHSTIAGDLRPLQNQRDALLDSHPDAVIHMQAMTEQDAVAAVDVFRGETSRIVAISSMDVYAGYGRLWRREEGEPATEPFTEDDPVRSVLHPYKHVFPGKEDYEKILVERTLAAAADELPYTVLRLGMVHGEGDPQHRNYEYVRRMEDGRQTILIDKVMAAWRTTRCHVDNCAAAIALAATDERAANRIYNVSEQHWDTEAEWIRKVGDCLGWEGDIVEAEADMLPPHLARPHDWRHHLMGDSTRIREELDFTEVIPEEEWLQKTCEWQRGREPEDTGFRVIDYDAEDAALQQIRGG